MGYLCHGYMLWLCLDLCSFGGVGVVILSLVYVHFSLCETSLLYCFSINLCWIGGGGGVSLPLGYMHSSICETYLL